MVVVCGWEVRDGGGDVITEGAVVMTTKESEGTKYEDGERGGCRCHP